MNRSLRLFIGIPIESTVRAELKTIQTALNESLNLPQASNIASSDFHLTLHFLGNIERDRLGFWLEALQKHSKLPSFSLALNRLVAFPSLNRARVIALAGAIGTSPISHLFQQVGNTVEELGICIEKRVYVPHVTLLRSKEIKIRSLVEKVPTLEVNVTSFALFESSLGSKEGRYQILKEYSLS